MIGIALVEYSLTMKWFTGNWTKNWSLIHVTFDQVFGNWHANFSPSWHEIYTAAEILRAKKDTKPIKVMVSTTNVNCFFFPNFSWAWQSCQIARQDTRQKKHMVSRSNDNFVPRIVPSLPTQDWWLRTKIPDSMGWKLSGVLQWHQTEIKQCSSASMTFRFITKMRVVDSFFWLLELLRLFSSVLLVGPGTKVIWQGYHGMFQTYVIQKKKRLAQSGHVHVEWQNIWIL